MSRGVRINKARNLSGASYLVESDLSDYPNSSATIVIASSAAVDVMSSGGGGGDTDAMRLIANQQISSGGHVVTGGMVYQEPIQISGGIVYHATPNSRASIDVKAYTSNYAALSMSWVSSAAVSGAYAFSGSTTIHPFYVDIHTNPLWLGVGWENLSSQAYSGDLVSGCLHCNIYYVWDDHGVLPGEGGQNSNSYLIDVDIYPYGGSTVYSGVVSYASAEYTRVCASSGGVSSCWSELLPGSSAIHSGLLPLSGFDDIPAGVWPHPISALVLSLTQPTSSSVDVLCSGIYQTHPFSTYDSSVLSSTVVKTSPAFSYGGYASYSSSIDMLEDGSRTATANYSAAVTGAFLTMDYVDNLEYIWDPGYLTMNAGFGSGYLKVGAGVSMGCGELVEVHDNSSWVVPPRVWDYGGYELRIDYDGIYLGDMEGIRRLRIPQWGSPMILEGWGGINISANPTGDRYLNPKPIVISAFSARLALSSGAVQVTAANGMAVNSKAVATELQTVIDSTNTSVTIPILSGGTAYVYTQPLTNLGITSVASTTAEDTIIFTAGIGCNLDIPVSVGLVEGGAVQSGQLNIADGSSYIMATTQQKAVIVEYQ